MKDALQHIKEALESQHGHVRVLEGFSLDVLGDDPTSNTRWHQIAVEGEWTGHWMGAFSLNERMFNEMVQHFGAKKNDTLVDYEHASVFGGEAPAAAWISEMQMRDSDGQRGLFARIEWTSRAAEYIRAREYRYLSPTIVFNTRDRKSGELTGASLHSVALTNTPFLDELPEVRLNSIRTAISGGSPSPQQEQDDMNEKQKAAMCALLGLSADATPEQMIETTRAQSSDVQAMERMCTALGLEEGSDDAAILTTVRTLKAQAARVVELEAEAAPLREQAARVAEIEADRRVEQARSAGQIIASNLEWAKALAAKDPSGFDAWAASAPKVVPTEPKTPVASHHVAAMGNAPTDEQVKALAATLSDADLKACKDANLSPEVYARANFEELSAGA